MAMHPHVPPRTAARAVVAAVVAAVIAVGGLAACSSSAPDMGASGHANDAGRSGAAVGSAHPLFLVGDERGEQLPAGTVKGWDDDVLGSPVAGDETFSHAFEAPAGASSVTSFISPRGQESNPAAWNASGWLALTPSGVLLPNLKLSGMTTAGTGSPSGTRALATAGGDYSVGIAFLDGQHVIEADFTSITVVPDADPVKATWTWSVPRP